MPTPEASPIASLVDRADAGDASAKDALFAALYGELHRLAEGHIRRSGGQVTIGATTLLHEAYLNMHGRESVSFPDRSRFLRYASWAMRGLIINYVQRRRAQKRGGEITFALLDEEKSKAQVRRFRWRALGRPSTSWRPWMPHWLSSSI